eukprot:14282075-Ditylum_brightwellii.AAC.1
MQRRTIPTLPPSFGMCRRMQARKNTGRPLLGCEKLLLQGIPYFRLALGNETEVQIGDLAGNAMSLTVVCATMLAAMSCKQLRIETQKTSH